jgi:cytochrome c551/c552
MRKISAMVFASGLILLGRPVAVPAAEIDGNTPQRLAADKGCTLCHADKRVKADGNAVLATAPSWPEIAKHYRGRADAEEHLVGLVLGGSVPDQRHWRGQAAFSSMWPNAAGTTREEARTLVRWILAWPEESAKLR